MSVTRHPDGWLVRRRRGGEEMRAFRTRYRDAVRLDEKWARIPPSRPPVRGSVFRSRGWKWSRGRRYPLDEWRATFRHRGRQHACSRSVRAHGSRRARALVEAWLEESLRTRGLA